MKAFILVVILALSGTALGQQAKDLPQPGRYQIATHRLLTNIDNVILLDTWTGKTWRLRGSDTWHLMTRLDTPEQVKEWNKANPPPSKQP
ncbi:MAG TPA: hypothetical protein VGL70_01215 [Candidatus Binatia bacterium]|jgi:hypothetical protein